MDSPIIVTLSRNESLLSSFFSLASFISDYIFIWENYRMSFVNGFWNWFLFLTSASPHLDITQVHICTRVHRSRRLVQDTAVNCHHTYPLYMNIGLEPVRHFESSNITLAIFIPFIYTHTYMYELLVFVVLFNVPTFPLIFSKVLLQDFLMQDI